MNSKKSNIKQILLSVAALLVIVLVGAGITYSWIEGGTTYSIQTENKGDVKTGEKPASTTTYNGTITLDPSSTNKVQLTDYDKNSNLAQDLFFSPVSSKDGINFFFPTTFDANGNATSYRKSNTNDIGTKFINYNFDVKATKKCYLSFDGAPIITATKSGTTVSDTSAFRIMLKSGNESVIVTTADSAKQSTVVTSEAGATSTLTAQPAKDYTHSETTVNKLFDYEAGETENLEVSVWLDGETASSDLLGSDVVTNFNLIVDQEKVTVGFDAITYTNTGALVSDGTSFTGGKIKVDSTTYGQQFSKQYVIDSTVSATAVANTGYKFVGWYSDEACTKLITSSTALSQTATEDTKYYAKFQEKPKYTITVATKTLPSGTGGTVTVNGSGTTYTGYQDTTTTIRATASSGYKFAGWYTDAACTGTVYSSSASATVTITANKTYYAKFLKTYSVTLGIKTDGTVGGSGGTVQIDGGTASTSVTKTVDYNASVTLSASPNTGYDFKGIYKADGTLVTSLSTITQQITTTTTYYAHFEKKPASTTTIYFETRSGFSTYSVYAYQKIDGVTSHYSGSWPGESATYDSTTGYYKYQFTTTETGQFNVIISNNGSSQYPASGSEGLVGDIGGTYLFKANNTLVEFDPADMLTFKVAPATTGGSVAINGGGTSVTVLSGTSVTISATPSSGYEFAGWYTNSACTTTIGSTYMTASQSVSVTKSTTYYAKFTQSTSSTTTIYVAPRSGYSSYYLWVWNDSGSNYSGGTWPGKAATYDSNTGCYKYTFTTSDTGTFKVIVSDNGNSQYPTSGGLSGTIGGTYLLNGSTLTSFNPSSNVVTITFDASSTNWVANDSAVIYLVDNSTSGQYQMTRTSSSSYTWTAKVPSAVTNIKFNRDDPSGGNWNSWSAGSRGTKTTYKTSSSTSGSWQ